MKSAFICLLFVLCCLSASAQRDAVHLRMDYHLLWDGKSHLLKVDLLYTPDKPDTTIFTYGEPEAGNQTDIFKVIENVQASQGDSVVMDAGRRRMIVWHKTGGLKKLHYEINGSLVSAAKHNNANEQFRPQLVPGSFYALTFNVFMAADTAAYKNITYVWDEWPKTFGYFSSLNPGAKPGKKVTVSAGQLMKGYMAMDEKLVVNNYKVFDVPYYAVTSGRDTLNNMQAGLTPFFKTFFPAIADFWKDYKGRDYFVSVLPFLNQVPSNYTGYGLEDGFSMRYAGPYDLNKEEVIAHETSHKWIGNKLELKQKGMENFWFEEGFNDYIAICVLAETGMMTKAEFVDYVNSKNLAPHYRSPVRTAPADSVEKYFWVNHDYEKLPYQRGFIYAFYFDNQIRLASAGKMTIRDFLLALWATRAAIKDRQLTIDDYIATASLFLPHAQIAGEVDKYLRQGQLLDFHNIKLIPDFKVTYTNGIPVLTMPDDADLLKVLSWK